MAQDYSFDVVSKLELQEVENAVNQAKNDLPNHGYALAVPLAPIAKILLAQLLVAFLPAGF